MIDVMNKLKESRRESRWGGGGMLLNKRKISLMTPTLSAGQ